jgi:hypothetical protein
VAIFFSLLLLGLASRTHCSVATCLRGKAPSPPGLLPDGLEITADLSVWLPGEGSALENAEQAIMLTIAHANWRHFQRCSYISSYLM